MGAIGLSELFPVPIAHLGLGRCYAARLKHTLIA